MVLTWAGKEGVYREGIWDETENVYGTSIRVRNTNYKRILCLNKCPNKPSGSVEIVRRISASSTTKVKVNPS